MRYMLDTNICIYLIKQKPPRVLERFRQNRVDQIGVSSITVSELMYGVEKSSKPRQNLMALAMFTAPLEIAAYGDEAVAAYGALRYRLEKQGSPMGALDTLIAAHALSLDCVLVTNNEKEFNRVSGLRIENWVNRSD